MKVSFMFMRKEFIALIVTLRCYNENQTTNQNIQQNNCKK